MTISAHTIVARFKMRKHVDTWELLRPPTDINKISSQDIRLTLLASRQW
jgi:hypothetical protein